MVERRVRSHRGRRALALAGLTAAALLGAGCGVEEEQPARAPATAPPETTTQAQAQPAPAQQQPSEPTPGVSQAGGGQASPSASDPTAQVPYSDPGAQPTAGAVPGTDPSLQPAPGPSATPAPGGDPSTGSGTPVAPAPPPDPTVPGGDPTVPGATPGVGTTEEPGAIGTLGVAPAFVPFASTSPWNTPVDTAPVDPNSARYVEEAAFRVGVVDVPGATTVRTDFRRADTRLFVNTTRWTTPVVDETGGTPVRVVCRQIICGPFAGVRTLTMPPDAAPDPRFDGWFTVINRAQGVAWDLWRARRVGDVISYQYIKRWDLNGPGFSPPVRVDPALAVGARGSGLPLFAGLILPAELQAGRINHALAISLPGPAQRNFVQPASVTDGIGRISSLPEGARIRLRPDAALGRLPGGASRRTANAIVDALKRYGAIVVDRSAVPTLYAQKNFNYGRVLFGNEVQTLRLEDFEVIQLGALEQDPPLSRQFGTASPGTAEGAGAPAGGGTGLGGTPGGSPTER